MNRPRLTPEQRAANQRANDIRIRAARCGIFNHDVADRTGHAREAMLDEGDDPSPMVQRGDNRIYTNLGDGARWHRAHRLGNR